MADDTRLSRRTLLAAGGALAGAGLGSTAQAAQPGPAVPADTGAVQGGRVMFPNWRGPADRPPAPSPAPQPPGQRIGYCVVGLGRLSLDEILPAFGATKRSRLAAVMSGTPDKAKLVARQYGLPEDAVYGYDEWDRLKANPAIQAVYVVTPNSVHRDNVLAAAAAGKQVLCEKPMAVASQECRDMIAACNEANVKLMIAYRCQYEPHNRAVIKLARSGEFGRPRLIQAFNGQTSGLPEQWRLKKALAGGGSLPDIGLYCLNAARFLTGEEPVEVIARSFSPPGDPRYAEVEETVNFMLRFPGGLVANCATSYGMHESRRLAVHTPAAAINLDNAFAYQGHRLHVSRRDGRAEAVEERRIPMQNQFALEMDHMAECILSNREPHTPGEEGVQDHRIMEAIYQSAASGQPVSLPRVEGLDRTRGPAPSAS